MRPTHGGWVVGLAVILFIIIAFLVNTKGSCDLYKFSTAKDIPARCLSHYTK